MSRLLFLGMVIHYRSTAAGPPASAGNFKNFYSYFVPLKGDTLLKNCQDQKTNMFPTYNITQANPVKHKI